MDLNQLMKDAKNNDKHANYEVAMYLESNPMWKTALGAVAYYERSAILGHVEGMYKAGTCYESGFGVSKDIDRAIYYYRSASTQYHPKAIYRLGVIYENGLGVQENLSKAISYYKLGSGIQDANCMYGLALCFRDGRGVEKNPSLAYHYFVAASKLSFYPAYVEVAKCNELGLGTPSNLSEAYSYYVKAAKRGDVAAMIKAGSLALEVFHNLVEAKYWFHKAKNANHPQADQKLAEFLKKYPFMEQNEGRVLKI